MLFLAALVAGVAAGLLTGGRWPEVRELRLRMPLLVLAALIVKQAGLWVPALARNAAAPVLYTLSLALLAAWSAWHWRRLPGAALIASGMALNLVAVAANRGRMPVVLPPGADADLFRDGFYGQYARASVDTPMVGLGDWVTIGPLAFYSPGDFVAAAGVAVAAFAVTRTVPRPG